MTGQRPSGTRTCEECGATYKSRNQQFCSRTCANRNTARNRANTRGFVMDPKGYKLLRMPTHPMASRGGYVMEQRFVMSEHLGRMLTSDEVVHHRNGDKADNRVENLEVMLKSVHDHKRKPAPKPIPCPHCGGMILPPRRIVRLVAAPTSRGE